MSDAPSPKSPKTTVVILGAAVVILGIAFLIAASATVYLVLRTRTLQDRIAQLRWELESARAGTERVQLLPESTRPIPIDQVLRLFDLNGFKPDPAGESLLGSMGAIKNKGDERLLKEPFKASRFQLGFSVKSRWYHGATVRFGEFDVYYSRGHWLNSAALVSTPAGERRFSGRIVDKPDEFARIEVRYEDGPLTFSYNGQIEDTVEIPPQYRTEPIVLGFCGYNSSYAIRDVVLTRR